MLKYFSRSRSWLICLMLLALGACSDGKDTYRAQPPAVVLQEIRIEPAQVSLPAGLSQQYAAIGIFSDASEQDLTGTVQWQSADKAVAVIDSLGVARAIASGTTEILARSGVVEASVPLTVTDAVVLDVAVYPPLARIKKGSTQDYRAFAIYSDGNLENVTFSAKW